MSVAMMNEDQQLNAPRGLPRGIFVAEGISLGQMPQSRKFSPFGRHLWKPIMV
mgnify:CR=1 FL=1